MKDKRSDTKSKYTLENSDCVRGFEVSALIIDNNLKIFQTASCKDDGSFVCMSNLNTVHRFATSENTCLCSGKKTNVTGRLKKIRLSRKAGLRRFNSMHCPSCGVFRSFKDTSDPTKCVSIN